MLSIKDVQSKLTNDEKLGVSGSQFKLNQGELNVARTANSFELNLITNLESKHPKTSIAYFSYHKDSKLKCHALISDDGIDPSRVDLPSLHYECDYWRKVLNNHRHNIYLSINNRLFITPSHIESLISSTIDFIKYGFELELTKGELAQAQKLIKILSVAVNNYRSRGQSLTLF